MKIKQSPFSQIVGHMCEILRSEPSDLIEKVSKLNLEVNKSYQVSLEKDKQSKVRVVNKLR